MPRVRITAVSGGMILAVLGAALFAWTWFPPPMKSETHTLAVADLMPDRLDLSLWSPAWLRGGTAESYVLQLARSGQARASGRWLASADLRAGGAWVRPASQQGGAIGPGEQVEYRWQVVARPGEVVEVEISLRLRRDQVEADRTVWAEAADLEVRDYLGMDAATARAAAVLAAIVGATTMAIASRLRDPLAEGKR